ncbi:unnamed protein product, partial [Strongylus vulgaris]
MSEDHINRGVGENEAVAVAYFDIAERMLPMGKVLQHIVSPPSNRAFEAVDALLRDIMQNDQPFVGKLSIVDGDFRQVLPIVEHGQRDDVVESCVNRSVLWPLFR